jgi:hypothetical protein
MESAGTSALRTPFVPLLLVSLGFLAWTGFQTGIFFTERETLSTVRTNQEPQVQAATKLRQALDGIARDTAKLAEGGNAGAKLIVDELRKRGVTINPAAPPPPPPK